MNSAAATSTPKESLREPRYLRMGGGTGETPPHLPDAPNPLILILGSPHPLKFWDSRVELAQTPPLSPARDGRQVLPPLVQVRPELPGAAPALPREGAQGGGAPGPPGLRGEREGQEVGTGEGGGAHLD